MHVHNAKAFATWLATPVAAEQLADVPFSVFGIGNSQWAATYQKFPVNINRRLTELGAHRLADMGEGDMDGGQVDMACAQWSLSVMIAVFQQADVPLPASLADSLYEKVTPGRAGSLRTCRTSTSCQ